MSDQASKSIKIKFEIDQASFNTVKSAIQDLAREVAKVSDQGAKAFGSSPGGGFGIATMAGAGKGSTQQGGSKPAFGVSADAVAQALAANVKVLKSSSNEGKDALKVISDATKAAVDSQIQHIAKLEERLKGLNNMYRESVAGTTAFRSTEDQKFFQAEALKAAGELGGARSALASMQGPSPQGLMSRIGASIFGGRGGGMVAGFGMNLASGNPFGAGIGLMSQLGPVGMGASIGALAANTGTQLRADAITGNLAHTLNAPMIASDVLGGIGKNYGALYQSLRSGDLKKVEALRRMTINGEWGTLGGQDRAENMAWQAQLQANGAGTWTDAVAKGAGWLGRQFTSDEAKKFAGNLSPQEIQVHEAMMKSAGTMDSERMRALSNEESKAQFQARNQFLDRLLNNAPGAISTQLASGLGGQSYARLDIAATKAGRDSAAIAAAMAQIRGTVGHGYAGQAWGVNTAQMAGIGNAAELLTIGAQFDRSGGNRAGSSSLYRAVMGAVGGGGLAEPVGGRLGGLVGNLASQAGNFTGDAGDLFNRLAPLIAGGTGGDQQKALTNMMLGTGQMAASAAGVDDNRKMARWAALSSGTSALGLGLGSAKLLENWASDPANRLSLTNMQDKDLPRELKSFGSVANVKRILGGAEDTVFSGVIRTNENIPGMNLLNAIDAAGGKTAYTAKNGPLTAEQRRDLAGLTAAFGDGTVRSVESQLELEDMTPTNPITGASGPRIGGRSRFQKALNAKEAANKQEDFNRAYGPSKAGDKDKILAREIQESVAQIGVVKADMEKGLGESVGRVENSLNQLADFIDRRFGFDLQGNKNPMPHKKGTPKSVPLTNVKKIIDVSGSIFGNGKKP